MSSKIGSFIIHLIWFDYYYLKERGYLISSILLDPALKLTNPLNLNLTTAAAAERENIIVKSWKTKMLRTQKVRWGQIQLERRRRRRNGNGNGNTWDCERGRPCWHREALLLLPCNGDRMHSTSPDPYQTAPLTTTLPPPHSSPYLSFSLNPFRKRDRSRLFLVLFLRSNRQRGFN